MQAKQIKIKKEVNVLHIDNNSLKKYWTLVEFMLKEGLKYDGNPFRVMIDIMSKYHVDELSKDNSERVVSSITYLNDDFDGGETEIMGEIIVPKKNYTLIIL